MSYYHANIERESIDNENFRKVIFTGKHSQLVLMSLKPGEEIGKEVHPHVDQFFRIEAGRGRAMIGGESVEVEDGSGLVVVAGTEHNIVNIGEEDLKIYTIYSPANHIDGRVHKTKADADADEEDEKFGHQ